MLHECSTINVKSLESQGKPTCACMHGDKVPRYKTYLLAAGSPKYWYLLFCTVTSTICRILIQWLCCIYRLVLKWQICSKQETYLDILFIKCVRLRYQLKTYTRESCRELTSAVMWSTIFATRWQWRAHVKQASFYRTWLWCSWKYIEMATYFYF